jgi:hypothetical protein
MIIMINLIVNIILLINYYLTLISFDYNLVIPTRKPTMAIIKSVPIRDTRIVISGIPPRCRKIDRKHVPVGDFPDTMSTDDIRAKCVEKLAETRKGWKSVIDCRMIVSPGAVETFQSGNEPAYNIKSVMLFDPKEIVEQMAI